MATHIHPLIAVLFPPANAGKWAFIPKNDNSGQLIVLEKWETLSEISYS